MNLLKTLRLHMDVYRYIVCAANFATKNKKYEQNNDKWQLLLFV